MQWLDATNLEGYLRVRGRLGPREPVVVRELGGGVSNVVLYVARPAAQGLDFVVKQSRPQLRVAEPWHCPVERIWREVDMLRTCAEISAAANRNGRECSSASRSLAVPEVLFEDRENYLFAMTAAPPGSQTWKDRLLASQVEREIAMVCGAWLGRLHAATWRDDELARGFGDQRVFDALRLDPYYRQLGRRFPDWRPQLDALVAETLRQRLALVHADFSPKNLLVWPQGLLLVDYETGHFGDPAFDLGFFLTHLALKAAWAGRRRADYLALADAFWQTYAAAVAPALPDGDFAELSRRAALHFAGCLWARLDGKSPVDYLGDPPARQGLRSLSQGLLARPARDWPGARERLEAALSDLASDEPAPPSSACAERAP